jgi:hypothetical protein
MKLFKIIASQGGRVLFDDRLEAPTPREARNQMRALLGLRSLTGVVYSITELPVELIGEIAETKLGEALRRFEDGATPPSLSEAIRVAAAEEVRRQLAELRAESLATAAAVPESNGSNGSNGHASRFDPFSDGAESTLDPGNSSACAVTPSPASSQSVAGSKTTAAWSSGSALEPRSGGGTSPVDDRPSPPMAGRSTGRPSRSSTGATAASSRRPPPSTFRSTR